MRPWLSLRVRLLVITAVLLIVGILISDAVVTTVLRRQLVDRVDHQLQPIALLFSRIDPSLVGSSGLVRPESLTQALDLINAVAVTYLNPDGTVVRSVASAGAPAPPRFGPSVPRGTVAGPSVPRGTVAGPSVPRGTVAGPDGTGWRVAVSPRLGGGVVVVAAPLTAIDAT